MKSYFLSLFCASFMVVSAVAAEKPALVEKHEIRMVKKVSDPALKAFHASVAKIYDTDGDNRLWLMTTVMQVGKEKLGFSLHEMIQLLNGRINDDFQVDITISDRDAALNPFVVTEGRALGTYRPKTDKFVQFFLPSTAGEAMDMGFNWTQKDLDKTERELRELMSDKRIHTYLFEMQTGGDARTNLTGFYIPESGEFLLMGFASNP